MNSLFKILKKKVNGLYFELINFQVGTLFLLVILLDAHPLYSQVANNVQPDIIVITTDQQSADAMSFFMGKRWINTPAMDELASEGIVFRNAYAANPLCAPSRNSIITGQLPHITGIEANDDLFNHSSKEPGRSWKNKDFKSIGTYFKKSGYETAYFGKWHLNYDTLDEKSHGFETTRFTSGRGDDAALPGIVNNFLSQPHEKPFFLFVSFLNPHNICEWARFQKLPNGTIGSVPELEELPPMKSNFLPPKNESDAMKLMRKSYHNNLKLFPVGNYSDEDWQRLAWGYYRLIEKMDSLVGKVLKAIKQNGYDGNTLILFTSDHGECLGAHQFNQKTVFYEESSRVPFILRFIGKLKPGNNKSLVNTGIDILPTLLDFANISKPCILTGVSLRAAAEKGEIVKRPFIVVENKMVQGAPVNGRVPILNGRMVRSVRYKYCLYDSLEHREELFDLENDPGETVNIALEKSSHSELIKERKYLEEFAVKNNDTLAINMLRCVNGK